MRVHLIGIGGTGMGALAGLLLAKGHEVRGSDGPIYPPMSDQLSALDIVVEKGYSPENLAWNPDQVVVGNTCTAENAEVVAAQERGYTLTSLPSMLREHLLVDKYPIVVAGTHGKTTTSSLLSHILLNARRDPSVFVGGVLSDIGRGWHSGRGSEFVIEGDEYDSAFFDKKSKFLHYQPQSAILTSVELDHVDIFSSMEAVREAFRQFVSLLPEDGLLLVAASSEEAVAVSAHCPGRVVMYDAASTEVPDATVEWGVHNVRVQSSGRCLFDVYQSGELFDSYEMIMSGRHNLENALACIAMAHFRGVSRREIHSGVATFSGVDRRQQFRGQAQGVMVIEDYGHHPSAIRTTLKGLHSRFGKRRLLALYEPRTATARRKTFQKEFAEAFANADELVVGALFKPDAVPKEERFDPERLALEVHQSGTPATYCPNVDDIVAHVVGSARAGDVVVVFSTGAWDDIFNKLFLALGDAVMPARRSHFTAISQLLVERGLHEHDLCEKKMSDFLALENENGLIGCVGLEMFEKEAVLRSLAVASSARGIGYGWMLADITIHIARYRGARRLYLGTETASDFFAAKHGFRVVDLSTVPESVLNSLTFTCRSESWIPMRLDL